MSELKPNFTILVDEARREVHFAASGFWSPDDMARFQSTLLQKSKPLIEQKIRFRVLGDLSGLAVQDRLMAESMRFMLHESEKLGMERLTMVITAPLVKMQYARLADGSNTEIFETKGEAIAWLRRV
ncbi:MAG: hypothetical protein AAFR32_05680 [Pseudomonadota bacterium]